MGKEICIRVLSGMMALWYLVAVVGLNVHICSHTGESFVTAALEDNSCESVHPGHVCCNSLSECVCGLDLHGNTADGRCLMDSGCCVNDFHSLMLSGESVNTMALSHMSVHTLPADRTRGNVPVQSSGHISGFDRPVSGLSCGRCSYSVLYCTFLI